MYFQRQIFFIFQTIPSVKTLCRTRIKLTLCSNETNCLSLPASNAQQLKSITEDFFENNKTYTVLSLSHIHLLISDNKSCFFFKKTPGFVQANIKFVRTRTFQLCQVAAFHGNSFNTKNAFRDISVQW